MSSTTRTQQLSTEKFLTIAVNLLNKALLEKSRTEAKVLYRKLEEGWGVPLTQVRMEDQSLVRFDLTLNHSEYRGRLKFSSFRSGVALLIANIVETLKKEEPVRTFYAEHDSKIALFGITAVTIEDEKPNVLVLGADASTGQPVVQLQLMYLDHDRLAPPEDSGEAAAG